MGVFLFIVGFLSFVQYTILTLCILTDGLEDIEIHTKSDLIYWLIPAGVLIIIFNKCVEAYNDLD